MRLRRLQISNYRSLQELDLEIRTHLVLVGPNESGKSSVLNAIELLLAAPGAVVAAAFEPIDFGEDDKPIAIAATLSEFTDEERAAFPDEITVMDSERLIVRLDVDLDLSGASPDISVMRWFPESGHRRAPSFEQRRMFRWSLIPANRSLSRDLLSTGSGMLRAVLSGVDLGSEEDRLRTALAEFQLGLKESVALGGVREQLARVLSSALPEGVADSDLEVVAPSALEDEPLAGVSLTLARHGKVSQITKQSDGVRALATIGVYGLAYNEARIVGVDEPEMHLHPTAQAAVGSLLAGSAAQQIVSTHSSRVAGAFEPVDLAALGVSIPARQLALSAPALEKRFLARWWSNEVVEALTAKVLVLVEGPSDRLIVEAAASAMGTPLSVSGVLLIDLGGGDNFKHFISIFGTDGFAVPLVGIVDEDREVAWAAALGVDPALLLDSGIHVSRPDLEGEYCQGIGGPEVAQILVQSGRFTPTKVRGSHPTLDTLPAHEVASVCRKDKILAAMAVADSLTAELSSKVSSVFAAVQRVASA